MDKPFTHRATRPTDHQLIVRARSGDQTAFEQLYSRHRRLALTVAARICGQASAEDAVQIAFFSIWQNLDSYRFERGSVKNWLILSVRNRSIDIVRAQKRKPTYQPEIGFDPEEPERTETLVAGREQTQDLIGALGRLPSNQRHVLFLAYFKGLSQTEIAGRLGVPLGTVKGRVRLGLEKLPDELTGTREHLLAAA